jgi:hypothetical protein
LIITKEIVINRGDVVTVDVECDPSLFADPPCETIQGVFSGRFSWGFEHSCFEPDQGGVVAPDESRRDFARAWVYFVGTEEPHPFEWEKKYRVKWLGKTTGPGMYGHLGASEYSMEVNEIREWREA